MRVVWFRSDLRVHDHPPLAAALSSGEEVVGLYAFDPRLMGTTDRYGFERMGPYRRRFLAEALEDLGRSLAALGVPLHVHLGSPEEWLAVQPSVTGLHYSGEAASLEKQAEAAMLRVLKGKKDRHETFTLVHPGDLPYPPERVPDLFTTFRKDVERGGLRLRDEVRTPKGRAPIPPPDLSWRAGIVRPDDPEPRFPNGRPMPGGETAGLARVRDWMWEKDRLRTYKETRNGMLDPDDSSHFSAYQAHGCLSPRRIMAEVRRYEAERGANESTYWLGFELLWRDFFRFTHMRFGDRLFRRSGIQGLEIEWSYDEALGDAWREGRTGFPIVDAAMIELSSTGYMSNRARQIVGSFLTKNLGLDWRLGAEWFESRLADYEPGANYGNWQYVAGVGNDAREFRLFNLRRQAEQYDPKGDFPRHWIPALSRLPGMRAYSPERESVDYPKPIVDFDRSARENRARYERATGGGRGGTMKGRPRA